jgi:hypothetical protein
MKRAKAEKKLAVRVRDYEATVNRLRANPKRASGYCKPGSMNGRK